MGIEAAPYLGLGLGPFMSPPEKRKGDRTVNIYELGRKLGRLNQEVQAILREVDYDAYGCASGVDFDKGNADEYQLFVEYQKVLSALDGISSILSYFERPVRQGVLCLNQESGRYELCGIPLHCGNHLEVLALDAAGEAYIWDRTRVEAEQGEYYIVRHRGKPPEGMIARIRLE